MICDNRTAKKERILFTSEKKQLNEEELEKVNGGDKIHEIQTEGNKSKYDEYIYVLSFDEPVQGQKYLFKDHNGNWLFGRLSNIYKKWFIGWIYDIDVEDGYIEDGIFVSDWNTTEVQYDCTWRAYKK